MKKLILHTLFLVFTTLTVISLTGMNSKAGVGKIEDNNGYSDRFREAESYFQKIEKPAFILPESYKVYGDDLSLVYESSDRNDEKLLDLIMKSDLILEFNNTHIYQLSR